MNAKAATTTKKPATKKSPAKPKGQGSGDAPKRAAKPKVPKKLSALDAAAKVLQEAGTPMTTGQMIEAMAEKGLWSTPNGQTPAATLYSAILREIGKKKAEARFKKTERGLFTFKG